MTALLPPPTAWLVMGDKPGDNGQLEVVGEALESRLGWRVERRRMAMRPEFITGKPRVEASLHHLDAARSDPLAPPWPDLVLTIGRRPSMAALWVKAQSGGRARIVRIGKPTGSAALFDLVIASAEVQVAPAANLLTIGLPLMRVDRPAVDAAAWAARWTDLARPLIGFLVGGPTGPYRFGRSALERLLGLAGAVAARGGTPFVVTSRRTPAAIADALERRLEKPARLARWRPATATADGAGNPYRALLGAADGFVVTGDSVSMLTEVARLGRPLQILPLTLGTLGGLDLARRRVAGALFARAGRPLWRDAARIAIRAGLGPQTRDFEAFHAMLLERGLACPLGGPFLPPSGAAGDDLDAVVARIAALLDEGEGRVAGP